MLGVALGPLLELAVVVGAMLGVTLGPLLELAVVVGTMLGVALGPLLELAAVVGAPRLASTIAIGSRSLGSVTV